MTESSSIQGYAILKEEILACVDRMAVLEHLAGFPLDEFVQKVRTDTLNLVVVGQFKRGKTCLINALMGVELLPTGVVPLTSIVTILTYRETLRIEVSFQDGSVREINPRELVEYVTEPGNPKNTKNIKEVLVSYPSPYLKDGVRLVDTPGVGSVYIHNTDVAYEYLPNCDAALFLLSVEQPVSKAELDFLKDVQQYSDKIFFLLNKIDYVTDREIQEAVEFTRRTIKEGAGLDVKVYPISAKLALEGKLNNSASLLDQSNLAAFSRVLSRFLVEEKGRILLISVTNNLLRILSQARLHLELELQSLTCPLDELQQKLLILEEKKEEILLEERNFDILLDGEVKRLVKTQLDVDLDAFKSEFIPQMELRFDVFLENHKDLSLKDLNDALETYVTDQVEPAFTAWRIKEDDRLAKASQAIYGRFALKINRIIDALLEFSSQLFAVPFSSVEAESLWTGESSFSYKLREEPVGLDLLADSLTQVFPKYVSNRFQKLKDYLFRKANSMIITKRKRHMLEAIEMQAGRMRHAFIERLTESKKRFRHEMVWKMRSTLEGISEALENGITQRAQGEKELVQRQMVLSQELFRLNELGGELMHIRKRIDTVCQPPQKPDEEK
jgi:GTPase SAR1 family protein